MIQEESSGCSMNSTSISSRCKKWIRASTEALSSCIGSRRKLACTPSLGRRCFDKPGKYGNALLLRCDALRVRLIDLTVLRNEPRGAIDVDVNCDGHILQLIATHLGLRPAERREQVQRAPRGFRNERLRVDGRPERVVSLGAAASVDSGDVRSRSASRDLSCQMAHPCPRSHLGQTPGRCGTAHSTQDRLSSAGLRSFAAKSSPRVVRIWTLLEVVVVSEVPHPRHFPSRGPRCEPLGIRWELAMPMSKVEVELTARWASLGSSVP